MSTLNGEIQEQVKVLEDYSRTFAKVRALDAIAKIGEPAIPSDEAEMNKNLSWIKGG